MAGRLTNADHGLTSCAQDIYDQSTTQKHRLGARLVVGDRVFRYVKAGAALIAGQLCEAAAFGGSLTAVQNDLVVSVTGAVGTKTVTVTSLTDAVTEDQFADGYLSIYDGSAATGLGQCYRIKSHPAIAAAGALKLTLYDDIVVIITAGTAKATITANPWKNVKVNATTSVGMPIGVPLVVVASGSYGWVQTWGPICGLIDGTVTWETALLRGTTTAGSFDGQVAGASSIINPQIGFLMSPCATTKYALIWLTIAP